MARRTIILSLILSVVPLAIALGVFRPYAVPRALPWLEQRLTKALARPVTVGDLAVTWLPLGLVAHDVKVGLADDDVCVHVQKVTVLPWFSRLATAKLGLRGIVLKGVRVIIDRTRPAAHDAHIGASSRPGAPVKKPVSIRDVALKDVDVSVMSPMGPFRVQGLDLLWVQDGRMTASARAAWYDGPRYPQLRRKHLSLQLQGKSRGPLWHPTGVHFDAIDVKALGLRVAAHGDIGQATGFSLNPFKHRLATGKSMGDAPLTLTGSLDGSLVPLFADAAALKSADAHISWRLLGTPDAPRWVCEAAVANILFKQQAQRLQATGSVVINTDEAILTEGVVAPQIEGWSASSPSSAKIRVSGSLKRDDTMTFSLNVQPEALSAADVRAVAPGLVSSVNFVELSGDLGAQGRVSSPLACQWQADLRSHHIDIEAQNNARAGILALTHPELHARGRVKNKTLWVDSARVNLLGQTLHAQARVGRDVDAGLALTLNATTDRFDIKSLGPIANLTYGGLVSGRADLVIAQQSATPWRLSAPVTVEDLVIGPVHIGTTTTHIDVAPMPKIKAGPKRRPSATVMALKAWRTQTGLQQNLTGDANIYFVPGGPCIRANLRVNDVALPRVLSMLRVPNSVALISGGQVDGTLFAHGPIVKPKGSADLQIHDLKLGALKLGDAFVPMTFSAANTRLSLSFSRQQGGLEATFALTDHGLIHLTGHMTDLVLGDIVRAGEPQVTGRINGRMRLVGALGRPSGSLIVEAQDFAVGRATLGDIVSDVRIDHDAIRAHVAAKDHEVLADFSCALKGAQHMRAKASLKAFKLATVLPWLGPNVSKRLADLDATTTMDVRLEGPIASPEHYQAELSVQALDARYRGLDVRLLRHAHMRLRSGRVDDIDFVLVGNNMRFAARGAYALAGFKRRLGHNLALSIEAESAAVALIVPQLRLGQGQLVGNVTWQGDDPKDVRGNLSARVDRLGLEGFDQALSHVVVKAQLVRDRWTISQGQAELDRGTVRLSGQMSKTLGLSVRLLLDSVRVYPTPDLQATLSGPVELIGPLDAPVLRGNVRVDALTYTAKLDLERLLQRQKAAPLRPPPIVWGKHVALDLRLVAPDTIRVNGPNVTLVAAADLTLKGTLQRFGLLGSITPKTLSLRWRDNTFVMLRSAISFVDPHEMVPSYSLVLKTEACNMQAEVFVKGDKDDFNIIASGRDAQGSVDAQDVLSCLQLGIRLREFDGNQKNAASLGDALPSGLDALWSVSGLDTQLKRLLPVRIDELRLTSGWSSIGQRNTARVVVGRKLQKKIALRYSRALDDVDDQAVSIAYALSDSTAVEGNWLSARDVPVGDFGVDFRLHWELP